MKPLDNPKITEKRKRIIFEKKYLYRVYKYFYQILLNNSVGIPKGKKLELGSGAGFIKEIIPDVTTSDIMKLHFCDMSFSAEKIPFKSNSVSAFYMLNTLHHIKDPKRAFCEFSRCLKKKGGIIMIEPANTPFSRFIYKNFHHELFDEKAKWKVDSKGNLSGSNQALPYILFKRDKNKFEEIFPNLKVLKYENHTPLSYLISGGFSQKSLLPHSFFNCIRQIEKILYPLNNTFGLFTTVVIQKN